MRSAFATGQYPIISETTGFEEIGVAPALLGPVMRRIDEIAVAVRMGSDKRFEHGAGRCVEDGGDVMAASTADAQQGTVVSVIADLVKSTSGDVFTFGRAEVDLAAHEILRIS